MENISDYKIVEFLSVNDSSNVTINDNETISDASHYNVMSLKTVQILFYIQYVAIFVLGNFGNFLVCYVVLKNKHMRTVTNFFIANLALADILLCSLAVPFTPLYYFIGSWVFGSALCHLVAMAQGVSVYISTLTLTSIAVDRFCIIIYPFRPRLNEKACYTIIISIWIFSINATLPYALYIGHALIDGSYYCEEFWPSELTRQIFSLFTSVMQFVIPFIVISICYIKISMKMGERVKVKCGSKTTKKEENEKDRKKRMNWMLISMVSIFGISWLPINVFHLIHDYYMPASTWEYTSLVFFITHIVAMSSTCYNPFLYAWLNENFRKEFQQVLPCFKKANSQRKDNKWRSETTCNGSKFTQTAVTQTMVAQTAVAQTTVTSALQGGANSIEMAQMNVCNLPIPEAQNSSVGLEIAEDCEQAIAKVPEDSII